MKLCVDLFCGLGGWAEGFLAENYWVVGFDIEHHDYGTGVYPGDFVMQDVMTLHGAQFKNAACIVASPPCQAYSYRAMPWKRAKALPPPDNSLFEACFRIQREASQAAGHHIPLVVENVCGAQKWVGRAKWHFGSFYLWGDVPALMPFTAGRSTKLPAGNTTSKIWSERPIARLCDALNVPGIKLSEVGFNVAAAQRYREGIKNPGVGHRPATRWTNPAENKDTFGWDKKSALRNSSSRSDSRKAASAHIAKIPFPLANHIARCFA